MKEMGWKKREGMKWGQLCDMIRQRMTMSIRVYERESGEKERYIKEMAWKESEGMEWGQRSHMIKATHDHQSIGSVGQQKVRSGHEKEK